jgi:hypothetical protein
MKKKPCDMTPREYWKYIHNKRNLNAHVRLNTKEAEEAMCHARGLKYLGDLSVRGTDILQSIGFIKNFQDTPERLPMYYQSTEYLLSQLVKEASELLKHASELQEYLHGARQSNQTLCQLRKELEEGCPYP